MARPFRAECTRIPEFTVLGEVPDGAAVAARALTRPVPPTERVGILRDCWAMANTAVAVATLPRTADMEDEHLTGPIDARAFIRGIDRYRFSELTETGKDLRDQRISPLDVMLHVCRIIDRLLDDCEFASLVPGANKPANEFMRARAAELVRVVQQLADASGVDLAIVGPSTAAHKAAMQELFALRDH